MREFEAIEEAKLDAELNTLAMCPQYIELLNLGNMGAIDACTEKDIYKCLNSTHFKFL